MQFRVVRLSGWRAVAIILAGLASLAVVAALLAVSFLVMLPVLLLSAIAWRFLPRPKMHTMNRAGEPDIIEGTYEVAPDETGRKQLEP